MENHFPKDNTEEENPEQTNRANHTPPDLTLVGEKLCESWLSSFIAGGVAEKPPSWMKASMPNFPTRSKPLAKGLTQACGVGEVSRHKGLEGQ